MNINNFSNPLHLNNVKVNDNYFNEYLNLIKTVVIPYQYNALNDLIPGAPKSYCISNFIKASSVCSSLKAGIPVPVFPVDKWEYKETECSFNSFLGWCFQDTDAYKWIEAASYVLVNEKNDALKKQVDDLVDLICSAQLENGYLDTLYIINDRSKIFSNLKDRHELYCFGHLTEAAVAYYNSTGNNKLLNAAIRFADLICDYFGDNKNQGYPGHEIAESALVKLYYITRNEKYINQAELFIKRRGTKPYYFDIERCYNRTDNSIDYEYNQAHMPAVKQNEAVGHAVRGVYLYRGMAEIAKVKKDDCVFNACKNIWNNIVNKKLYITGGIGSTAVGEAFSFDYDLPNDLAYCETCASIGLAMFSRRMFEINPISSYFDVFEQALYNTVLASMGSDGKSFFYVNPLEVLPVASKKDERKNHVKTQRQKWFGCACCPPNLARFLSSIGEYCFSENSSTLFVNLYIGANAQFTNGCIDVQSNYLSSGNVILYVKPNKPFKLALRIPAWCNNFTINCNYEMINGYAVLSINKNTNVEISFDLKVKLIRCSNLVRANIGKVAVARGPVVYCAESIDNCENLQFLKINPNGDFVFNENGTIIADGFVEQPDESLYDEYKPVPLKKCKITLIPYNSWGNRGETEMSVYLRV